jgi:hypothetical protein
MVKSPLKSHDVNPFLSHSITVKITVNVKSPGSPGSAKVHEIFVLRRPQGQFMNIWGKKMGRRSSLKPDVIY